MLQMAISKLEQHKKFTIVFIGGSHDGAAKEVERVPPVVQMPVAKKPQSFGVGDPAPLMREEYTRLDLNLDCPNYRSGDVAAVLYAHHALTDAEVLNIILTRYVQGSESKKD